MINLNRKDLFGKSGIYKLKTSINNKIYIGSSSNLYKRLSFHFEKLRKNCHQNIKLQNHINKYGIDCLTFEIVELCDVTELEKREQYYLDFFNAVKSGFNIALEVSSSRGIKQSDETIKKRSNSLKGRKLSENHKNKISVANQGKVSSRKGATLSMETKKKISEAHRGRKVINPRILEKMSLVRKNKKMGIEHWRHKKVLQFDRENNLIKEWSCATEVERILRIKQSNISKVCNNYRELAGGYKWKFK